MSSDGSISFKDQALKTVVKGASISFAGLLISNLILYFNRLLLARYLSVNEYGLFYLGVSVLNIVVIFASLELSSAIVRYAPYFAAKNDEKKVRGVFISALKINILLSIAAFLILFFFSDYIAVVFFHDISFSFVLKIFSLLLPFFVLYKIGEAGMISFKRMDYCSIIRDFLRPMLTLVLMFALLFLGFGLQGAAVSYAAGMVVASVIFLIVIEKRVFPLFKRNTKSAHMEKKMLGYSIPIVLYFAVWSSALRIDTILLGVLKTSAEVGLYQTAMPTAQLLTIPSIALASLFLPVISELLSNNRSKEISETYKIASKWSFYVTFPLFLVLFLYSGAVINVLFGYDYISAASTLSIISIGFIIYTFNVFAINVLNLLEKTKLLFVNGSIGLAVTIALNYLLIPLYGINGAALAMTIAYSMLTLFTIGEAYYFSRTLPLHRDMIKSLAAGGVSVSIVYYLTKIIFTDLNVIILAAMLILFLIMYSLLLLVLRGLGKEDIMILKAIEKKTGMKIDFIRNIIKKFI